MSDKSELAIPDESCACPPEADLEPATALPPDEADRELARLAKALAHPARLRIVRLLGRAGVCICGEIVEELDLAQSTVSQHLKVLKEAGLLRGEVDGPRVCYCLDHAALRRAHALLGALADG